MDVNSTIQTRSANKFRYPCQPVKCINTVPSENRKNWSLTILDSTNKKQLGQLYIYSPSLHQDLNRKFFKCFHNYTAKNMIQNSLRKEDLDLIIDELVILENFERSENGIETISSIKELKYSLASESDFPSVIILDDLSDKKEWSRSSSIVWAM